MQGHVSSHNVYCLLVPPLILSCIPSWCSLFNSVSITCSLFTCHRFLHNYAALTAPVLAIDIAGSTTAGELLTLTCRVTVVEGLTVQPDVEWVDSGGSVVTSVNDVTVGSVMRSSNVSTLVLEFNPLHTLHGGQYTCKATINIQSIDVSGLSGNSSQNVTVQSKHCSEF